MRSNEIDASLNCYGAIVTLVSSDGVAFSTNLHGVFSVFERLQFHVRSNMPVSMKRHHQKKPSLQHWPTERLCHWHSSNLRSAFRRENIVNTRLGGLTTKSKKSAHPRVHHQKQNCGYDAKLRASPINARPSGNQPLVSDYLYRGRKIDSTLH